MGRVKPTGLKLAIGIIGIAGFVLAPATTALANPEYRVDPQAGKAGASACSGTVIVPAPVLRDHASSACVSAGNDRAFTGSAALVGVGSAFVQAGGGYVPQAPGVCAWYFHDWAGNFTSGRYCANKGGCVLNDTVVLVCHPR